MRRYVVWFPANREGEFEFLCSTQCHWTKDKTEALREAKEGIEEHQLSCDPPLSKKEALEELGGQPVVYELTLKRIYK